LDRLIILIVILRRMVCQACRHREIHRPDRTSTYLRQREREREKKIKVSEDEGILGK